MKYSDFKYIIGPIYNVPISKFPEDRLGKPALPYCHLCGFDELKKEVRGISRELFNKDALWYHFYVLRGESDYGDYLAYKTEEQWIVDRMIYEAPAFVYEGKDVELS